MSSRAAGCGREERERPQGPGTVCLLYCAEKPWPRSSEVNNNTWQAGCAVPPVVSERDLHPSLEPGKPHPPGSSQGGTDGGRDGLRSIFPGTIDRRACARCSCGTDVVPRSVSGQWTPSLRRWSAGVQGTTRSNGGESYKDCS